MAYPSAPRADGLLFNGPLVRPIKRAIASEVVALFNDRAKGEKPVHRRPDGMFGPSAVAWRVHGDVTSMMVGGVASLLLQMLHPAVLAGVWDHSRFRQDMLGRLRRTARFIAVTTYGSEPEARIAIDHVRAIHGHVRGTLPDGTPYCANDPPSLAWVHVTGAASFLDAWIRYAEPDMPAADQDRYFAETARVALALGADPVPLTRADAEALVRDMRPNLLADARTREVCGIVLRQPARGRLAEPLQALATQAAIDLLPDWARRLHNLPAPSLGPPLVRAGTLGLARTLRWAFT